MTLDELRRRLAFLNEGRIAELLYALRCGIKAERQNQQWSVPPYLRSKTPVNTNTETRRKPAKANNANKKEINIFHTAFNAEYVKLMSIE